MEQYGMEADGIVTGMTDTHAYGSHAQHTNNLDGILRDHRDVPIPLNPADYRHQAYLGPDCGYSETNDLGERFVFKDGKLLKVEPNDDQRMQVISAV